MEFHEIIERTDLDFWCEARKRIVIELHKRGDVESISELARLIQRSFSVTYRHLTVLKKHGIVNFRKITSGQYRMISLQNPHERLEKIFMEGGK